MLIEFATIATLMNARSVPEQVPPNPPVHTDSGVQPQQSPHAVDCGALPTQGAMNECFANQAQRSQHTLDMLVQELRGTLTSDEVAKLKTVGENWIKYREAHCKWSAAFAEGGSIQPSLYWSCIDELTWGRIDELKVFLCEGRGMTGICDDSRRYDRPARSSGQ